MLCDRSVKNSARSHITVYQLITTQVIFTTHNLNLYHTGIWKFRNFCNISDSYFRKIASSVINAVLMFMSVISCNRTVLSINAVYLQFVHILEPTTSSARCSWVTMVAVDVNVEPMGRSPVITLRVVSVYISP